MSYQLNCDRCSATGIDSGYYLAVQVWEELPRGGGIVNGFEVRKEMHFFQKCKGEILKAILNTLQAAALTR